MTGTTLKNTTSKGNVKMEKISIEKTKKRKINNLITESLELGWKLEISKQSELYAILKDQEKIGFIKALKLKGNFSSPIVMSSTDITHIWIKPEERGKGYGTQAIIELIEKIPSISFNDPNYSLVKILEKLDYVKPVGENSFISRIPFTIYAGPMLGLPADANAFTITFYHGIHDYLVFLRGEDPVLIPASAYSRSDKNLDQSKREYIFDREKFLKKDNQLLMALGHLLNQQHGFE